jgi:hypothetical protein
VILIDTYVGRSAATEPAALRPLYPWLDGIRASTTARLLRGTTVPVMLGIIQPLLPTDISTLLHHLPGGGAPIVPGGLQLPGS